MDNATAERAGGGAVRADKGHMERVVEILSTRHELKPADAASLALVPHFRRTYRAGAYVVREAEPPPDNCSFVLSGLAMRQKMTRDGRRQILSIHMAGEFLDAQHLFLSKADHSVTTLTALEVLELDRAALREAAITHPNVSRTLWKESLTEASLFREWILNVGARKAPARVAHLLCEIVARVEAAGLGSRSTFEIPMTQDQIGDALGLTAVHVNRTLRALHTQGLIVRSGRSIRISNWERLCKAADFNDLYLHKAD
ncbi:Crp/Fnr family transcriptional regulator [Xanthobacteraceae bacterium A53D]